MSDDKTKQPSDGEKIKPAEPAAEETDEAEETPRPDPTRFGDWEKNGRCIDF